MILCSYCNINIVDDGVTILASFNKQYQSYKSKILFYSWDYDSVFKSGSANNADLYYDSILRYSVQDYKMTNPLLRKDYKQIFQSF